MAKRLIKYKEGLSLDMNQVSNSLYLLQVLNHYINFVKPAYEEFCMPTKKFADVIIPRGADNKIAIELISHHITDMLSSPPTLEARHHSYYRDSFCIDIYTLFSSIRGAHCGHSLLAYGTNQYQEVLYK